MLSDDVFRRAFEGVSGRLATWAEAQRATALVEHEATPEFVRVRLQPFASTACPVELMLHRQSQTFDVQFAAADTWEDRPVGNDPDHLATLLQAVVEGRVVMRTRHSAGTGMTLAHTVVVTPREGRAFVFERDSPWQPAKSATSVHQDRHWAPYHRA